MSSIVVSNALTLQFLPPQAQWPDVLTKALSADKGFSVNLGIGQILEAELWGLAFGLEMALDKERRTILLTVLQDGATIWIWAFASLIIPM
ncbi:hypothetical protein L3X38_033456 [Prunus dulcis]|uniref:Uncharacterized protein n=1 Tax=Prunus dulcis TaxID=3755 RepID=A0AAD4YXM6_PRUDU|nr:hypothetical protein L3X38_033456 [Prunus dulcis]